MIISERQQHYPTFAASYSQAVKGASRSSPNQRTRFGETEQQAQAADETPENQQGVIDKLLQGPESAQEGYAYYVISSIGERHFPNRPTAIEFALSDPTVTDAGYRRFDMTERIDLRLTSSFIEYV